MFKRYSSKALTCFIIISLVECRCLNKEMVMTVVSSYVHMHDVCLGFLKYAVSCIDNNETYTCTFQGVTLDRELMAQELLETRILPDISHG